MSGVNLVRTTTYMVTVGVADGKDSSGGDETTPQVDTTIAVTIEVSERPYGPVVSTPTVTATTPVSVDRELGRADRLGLIDRDLGL